MGNCALLEERGRSIVARIDLTQNRILAEARNALCAGLVQFGSAFALKLRAWLGTSGLAAVATLARRQVFRPEIR
jgi:hypothetical protein